MKTKAQLIKELKKEANKAIQKLYSVTFKQEERNKGYLQIMQILSDKIKQVQSL